MVTYMSAASENLPGNVFDPHCPYTRVILDQIGARWTVLVVLSLQDGALRFSELRRRIGGISPKVLTQTMRMLERDGIVARRVHAEVPPRVDYSLTRLGHSLEQPITAVRSWAETHVPNILAARDAYDLSNQGSE
jgi:DNA-binding HxlR family transcriptional regulator